MLRTRTRPPWVQTRAKPCALRLRERWATDTLSLKWSMGRERVSAYLLGCRARCG